MSYLLKVLAIFGDFPMSFVLSLFVSSLSSGCPHAIPRRQTLVTYDPTLFFFSPTHLRKLFYEFTWQAPWSSFPVCDVSFHWETTEKKNDRTDMNWCHIIGTNAAWNPHDGTCWRCEPMNWMGWEREKKGSWSYVMWVCFWCFFVIFWVVCFGFWCRVVLCHCLLFLKFPSM